jgi:hypothetical protein
MHFFPLFLISLLSTPFTGAEEPLDVLIVNGLIVDGAGVVARPGAVGIKTCRIVPAAEVRFKAKRTLDGGGA